MTNYEWLVTRGELKIFIQKLYWFFTGTVINKYKIPIEKEIEDYSDDEKLTIIAKWLQEEHREPLKPCPFCGGDGEMMQIHQFIYYVRCKNCEAQTKNYGRIDDAEEEWNRRTEK